MRKLLFSPLLLLSLLLVVPNVTASEEQKAQSTIESGGFLHAVYFWLKNPDSEKDRKEFEEHLNTFINSSQYVKSKFIGTSAPSDRDVVDSSFTYTLVLSFASKEDQDKYQAEDVHTTFVNNAKHLWKKVVVYDAFNTL